MASSYTTRNGRTSKRGLFLGGVWQCDCEPRLPADKFQVKNGGKNHGRWFYTCQKPQHKRCKFFLWTDDAKVREEAAVLSNSRSEPPAQPQTPRKPRAAEIPPTPDTKTSKFGSDRAGRVQEKYQGKSEADSSFDWSSSNDEALLEAELQTSKEQVPFETPKKAARTLSTTSPGKRVFRQSAEQDNDADDTWPLSDDVFATPSTSTKSGVAGLLSPGDTPARDRSQFVVPDSAPSALAVEVLAVLSKVPLSSEVKKELIDLLNRHDLRTQGIIKGRDITRLAVQSKEKKIAELQARIGALEAERETNRAVISHMKHDIATSPKVSRSARKIPGRRSEV
ncbi:hypothetical protein PV08_01478 [Exophiala spinifera]|uniref:GRF-type domain-containing protein n=1 Tax=Exophiala spinifera TaxID=91928 RepID=A0A0D2CBJ9_9EURO|nr:uncharacterized protein PV08_01478 [Exophiala spinifera]KIW20899.1 hypothetical protein PV08_01478 [Exophiala spinifera]